MKGGAKGLRKAAIQLSIATHSNMTDLLHLPRRELVDLCNEVADVWREMEH